MADGESVLVPADDLEALRSAVVRGKPGYAAAQRLLAHAVRPESPLTVGDLRKSLASLSDDAKICVEVPLDGMGWLVGAYGIASDCVLPPWGTNPMEEATVGVLVLEVGHVRP